MELGLTDTARLDKGGYTIDTSWWGSLNIFDLTGGALRYQASNREGLCISSLACVPKLMPAGTLSQPPLLKFLLIIEADRQRDDI